MPATNPVPACRRLLLVEDNPDGRDTLRLVLELSGFEVEVAEDGLMGLRLALAWQPNFDSGLRGSLFGHGKTVIRGGYWHFYILPNDGFYMAPDDAPFALYCEGNGFEGTVSAEAAGIIACLMAYSHQSFQIYDPRISNAFQKLLACVHRHPEAPLIFRAID